MLSIEGSFACKEHTCLGFGYRCVFIDDKDAFENCWIRLLVLVLV